MIVVNLDVMMAKRKISSGELADRVGITPANLSILKNNKGITMVALVVTIIVILILAGISIGQGDKAIKISQLENLRTNMLLIQTKSKEYLENANFNLGTNIDKVTEEEKTNRVNKAKENLKGTEITDGNIFDGNINITTEQITEDNTNYIYYYKLTTEDLEKMGLKNVESNDKKGWYIVKYDIKNDEAEIYNQKGFEKENKTYYSLSEIKNLQA